MEPYRNLSGTSGVDAYECGTDWITVRFHGGRTYRYDHGAPGPAHVARMQELARAGRGLGTYISQHVREAYASVEP